MPPSFDSVQEQIISAANKRSLGAPFIFIPDRYAKGSKGQNGQPTDLVWACNNCVCLMYLRDAKESLEEADDHNLRQAKGWLRSWRSGQRLTGKNPWHVFSIEWNATLRKIVLSVVKCEGAMARISAFDNAQFGLSLCATIPGSALVRMMEIGCSSVDLIATLSAIRKRNAPIAETELLDWLDGYKGLCQTAADPKRDWRVLAQDDVLRPIAEMLLSTRCRDDMEPARSGVKSVGMESLKDTLNDINLGDYLSLAIESKRLIEEVRQTKQGVFCLHKLMHYDCYLRVDPLWPSEYSTIIEDTASHWKRLRDSGTFREGPIIHYFCDPLSAIMVDHPRAGVSHTETLIGRWQIS